MADIVDVAFANAFILKLSKSIQALCHGCMEYDTGVEIFGYIAVNIDSKSQVDYVVNEKVKKSSDNSTTFMSNSFLAKKDMSSSSRDSACSPVLELQTLAVHLTQKPQKKDNLSYQLETKDLKHTKCEPKENSLYDDLTPSMFHDQNESIRRTLTHSTQLSNSSSLQAADTSTSYQHEEVSQQSTYLSKRPCLSSRQLYHDSLRHNHNFKKEIPDDRNLCQAKSLSNKIDLSKNVHNGNSSGTQPVVSKMEFSQMPQDETQNHSSLEFNNGIVNMQHSYSISNHNTVDDKHMVETCHQNVNKYIHNPTETMEPEHNDVEDIVYDVDEEDDVQVQFQGAGSEYPQDQSDNTTGHTTKELRKPSFCKKCTASFPNEKELTTHNQQIHKQNLQYVCPKCGKGYQSYRGFRVHKARHEGKCHTCPVCGCKLFDNYTLKRHVRKIHGEKVLADLEHSQLIDRKYNNTITTHLDSLC